MDMCSASGMAKTILQGTVHGGRRQGRQKSVGKTTSGPGVHRIPEGSGEQRRMEETDCEVFCGTPMIPVVKE